ncbi:MAG: hypothetical protein ACR2PX_01160 [Endozoicomonas sp.]|uniref:hypothetical protein n=1 Tax=Endozoicomonas sp. TaxID=1892382 RepID=UPI003D9B1D52
MPIFANVRPESKYFAGQAQEEPFPVTLVPDGGGYHWQGGVGGKYRTMDLFFFIKQEDRFREFNLPNLSEIPQLEITKNAILNGVGNHWGSGYWEKVSELAEELLSAAREEYQIQANREAEERERELIPKP